MATKTKTKPKKGVLGLIKSLQGSMDMLYKNTYISKPTNTKDLEAIKHDIDANLDNIASSNVSSMGVSNISQLYSRIDAKQAMDGKSKSLTRDIEDLFSNKALTDGLLTSFTENKYLKDYDEDIDILCKYMPKLKDALNAKKDGVLAADNYSKDFLNILNESNVNKELSFEQRIKDMKAKYKLTTFLEECYDNAATYGEQFIYIVPYSKAFNRMIKNGKVKDLQAPQLESTRIGNPNIITENFLFDHEKVVVESSTGETFNGQSHKEFKVELNLTGVIESAVNNQLSKKIVLEKTASFDSTIDGDLEFERPGSDSNDGFIDMNKTKKPDSKLKMPGCILKKLKRENVIPVYIDDACLGYYYIECEFQDLFTASSLFNLTSPYKNNRMTLQNEVNKKDAVLRQLSAQLSKFIDSSFIKANQDLKEEIYMILKYNQTQNNREPVGMKITFLPAEDVIHMKFRTDQNTHRGISDLDDALIPAKLYVSLYTTNTLGMITRGHDKRVYYVKQNIDSNISKTLLNTINQIKKSNFGSRELTSMKNMLNIQGKFNDLLVPIGPSGDPPINFEIMQGQDINPQTELLETLEEMAISSTDVPYEFIQSVKMVDFATRLTMSNGKFLRAIFKRQALTEIFFSRIVTKVYNYEYEQDDNLEVMLPPPAFLNISNANQMIQSVNEYVGNIIEMEMEEETDENVKAIYSKKLKLHYLSTYLDMNAIKKYKDQSLIEAQQKKEQEA